MYYIKIGLNLAIDLDKFTVFRVETQPALPHTVFWLIGLTDTGGYTRIEQFDNEEEAQEVLDYIASTKEDSTSIPVNQIMPIERMVFPEEMEDTFPGTIRDPVEPSVTDPVKPPTKHLWDTPTQEDY